MKKKFYASLVSLLIIASAVISLNFMGNTSSAATRYCDTNSIMKCGALSASEMNQKYNANVTGDLPAIYNHYGMSAGMIAQIGTAKVGQVGKNGQVVVDGKVIATNAQSVGRHFVNGSTAIKIGSKTIYQRPTQNVFIDEWQTAFVFQKADGSFASAIIMSCGNPVVATPKPVPPKLVYSCNSLTAKTISRTQFTFSTTRTIQNVKYLRTVFVVLDANGHEVARSDSPSSTFTYNQTKPGAYSVNARVIVDINGKPTASPVGNCKANFSVKPELVYSCNSLTATKITRTQFNFKTTRTVQNVKYLRTVFVIRDSNGKEVNRVNDADGVYTYNQTKVGAYTVEAQVVVDVNGKETFTAVGKCKASFEVKPESVVPVYECTSLELIAKSSTSYEFKTIAYIEGKVTIKEVSVDFGDGKSQTVKYGTNASHTYVPGTYTAIATVFFTVDGKTISKSSNTCKVSVAVEQPPVECKPGIPVGDARCEEECKPGIPMGDARCEETPQVLAATGPASFISGLFGSSALGLGITSFVRSRRALRDSLNR